MRNKILGYVYKDNDVHSNYHYGGLPGRPAGPAATRPTGLTDACMNNNNNNNNNDLETFLGRALTRGPLIFVDCWASSASLVPFFSSKLI